jgi:HSP20 family protein
MGIRNPSSWMWEEACEMLERAQRMQRQFFRLGHAIEAHPRWEPPVDIVAYGSEVQIMIALPGVAPEHVSVRIQDGVLSVTAIRPLPMTRQTTAIHRLEIPYGRFERRVVLPAGEYRLMDQGCANGCLVLRLSST